MINKTSPIFEHAHPVTFSFLKSLSLCKKSTHLISPFLRYSRFRIPWPKMQYPFLTTTIEKLLKELLAFLYFYQHTKNQFIPSIPSWDTSSFSVLRPQRPHSSLTMTTPILFNEFLIFKNLYQLAKNQLFHHFTSRDLVDFKILKSDWLRSFWPIS